MLGQGCNQQAWHDLELGTLPPSTWLSPSGQWVRYCLLRLSWAPSAIFPAAQPRALRGALPGAECGWCEAAGLRGVVSAQGGQGEC